MKKNKRRRVKMFGMKKRKANKVEPEENENDEEPDSSDLDADIQDAVEDDFTGEDPAPKPKMGKIAPKPQKDAPEAKSPDSAGYKPQDYINAPMGSFEAEISNLLLGIYVELRKLRELAEKDENGERD